MGFLARLAGANLLATSAILAAGVATLAVLLNALVLQAGRHPAPLFPTRPYTGEHQRPPVRGGGDAVVRGRATADQARVEFSPLIRDLQIALAARELYPGPVDGLAGPNTHAAIAAYQKSHGLPVDGEASTALLAHISLPTGPVPPPSPRAYRHAGPMPPGEILSTTGKASVAAIQKALAELGYGPVEADGIYGKQTSIAIQRFEMDRGLSISGEIKPALVKELQRIGGLSVN